jgi:hypothetical protein
VTGDHGWFSKLVWFRGRDGLGCFLTAFLVDRGRQGPENQA